MPFILNEDKALKLKLGGLTVEDGTATPKAVPVYYRLPENEVRAQSYPYVTLDMVNIGEDTERTHRGYGNLEYVPEGLTPLAANYYKTEWPTPYFLDYQVTTFSRYAQHDRALLGQLLQKKYLPHHHGFLLIPEDNTIRRLDLSGIVNGDVVDQNQKRLFRKIFNIRVSSELLISQVTAVREVLSVNLAIKRLSNN